MKFASRQLLLLSCGLLFACAQPSNKAETSAPVHSLNSASSAPTAAEIEAHTKWLSDDALEGRRAGTPMADAAAVYLAEQLKAAGLEPAGENGGWYQSFPLAQAAQAGECSLSVGDKSFENVGSLALSAEGTASGELTSASYGVVLESYNIDHFAGANVAGKIVLLRRYTEWGPKAEDKLASLGALRSKVRNARAAGAVAVIVGTHPDELAAGGDAEIKFSASHGTGGIPIITVSPSQFVELEQLIGETLSLSVAIERPIAETLNVLAKVTGKSDEIISIGAHYDHLGWGGDGSLAPGVEAIHNGADDNASGSAVVLEIAEAIAAGDQPQRTMLFCFWGAEEEGLIGSKYWVANPTVPKDKILSNVNMDMVGRLQSGGITVGSHSTASGFASALNVAQASIDTRGGATAENALQLNLTGEDLPGGGGSDHMAFHSDGISAVFFFSGLHSDYHKPSDDWEKLDYQRMSTLAHGTIAMLHELASTDSSELEYVKPAPVAHGGGGNRRSGGGVWFGSIPDYAGEGGDAGMKLGGTVPGGPAESAGLLKDDVITAIDDF